MSSIYKILKAYWGYDNFRPLQEEIINAVIEGKDTLALLPTGGGKSVCFQVPAIALGGICIVVTPLIALMKDQVEQLKKKGIKAVAIYSGLHNREIDILLDNCIYGDVQFLYLSPERLKTDLLIERVQRMKVNLLAVDEAHCISQWGYDFRPAYLEIAAFRSIIPSAKIIAVTASATKIVQKDILDKLDFKNPITFKKSFSRSNLSYSSLYEENKFKRLLKILKKVPGTSIVYVRSRKRTQDLAKELQRNGISSGFYHAGLSNEERSEKQDKWINNKIRVIVATNAFGMGIDKPDVRTVVHLDLPESLEAYYQEAGRAGRDEKKAYAIILFNKIDLDNLRLRKTQEFPTPEFIRRVYQSLSNYLKIAVGSSSMASFDFDFEDFQKTFDLESLPAYFSIKKLEESGFIQLNESFYNPSRLFIPVDNKTLYAFLISHAELDHLIKIILRMYGGELFTNFIPVNEQELAKNAKMNPSQVISHLRTLHQKNIVIYEPRKEKPQLTFLTPRYDSAKLPLNVKAMEEKKVLNLSKMEAVINYTQHLYRCRTSLILEYFDEEVEADCGMCDNCLNKKKNEPTGFSTDLRNKILMELQTKDYEISDLLGQIKPNNERAFIACLRIMVSTGEIGYNSKGEITSKT